MNHHHHYYHHHHNLPFSLAIFSSFPSLFCFLGGVWLAVAGLNINFSVVQYFSKSTWWGWFDLRSWLGWTQIQETRDVQLHILHRDQMVCWGIIHIGRWTKFQKGNNCSLLLNLPLHWTWTLDRETWIKTESNIQLYLNLMAPSWLQFSLKAFTWIRIGFTFPRPPSFWDRSMPI